MRGGWVERLRTAHTGERTEDERAVQHIVLKRRADEVAVRVVMIALLGLGSLSAVLGALASGDATRFWQDFLVGVVLLIALPIPIWFLQRWQATGRPVVIPERQREFRRMRLALIGLWLFGVGTVSVGLAINLRDGAPFAANLAVGILIAYMAGWGGLLVASLRIARRFRPHAEEASDQP